MASKLFSINYPDERVARPYVFPPEESPLSDHPDFNSKLLEFHSTIADLPKNFKGTRMVFNKLAKRIYKKDRAHNEAII